MRCEEVRRILDLYIDGELGPKEKVLVEGHLEECDVCRGYARDLYRTKVLISDAYREIKAPFSLRLRVRNAVKVHSVRSRMKLAWAVAVFALILVALAFLLRPERVAAPKQVPVADQPSQRVFPTKVQIPLVSPPSQPSPVEPVSYPVK